MMRLFVVSSSGSRVLDLDLFRVSDLLRLFDPLLDLLIFLSLGGVTDLHDERMFFVFCVSTSDLSMMSSIRKLVVKIE